MLDTGLDSSALAERGALWTAREICQQPAMLRATHAGLEARADEIREWLGPLVARKDLRVILAGAGTSAFIGECLAPYLDGQLAGRCDAIATTDIVAAPRAHLARGQPTLLVSFARSGNSPESLATVELADQLVDEVHHLVVTCNPQGALARRVQASASSLLLLMPEKTNDRGFAMTSSFSCMSYAALTALRGPDPARATLDTVTNAMEDAIAHESVRMRALSALAFERVVYLGSHVLGGLAREAALKLLELSDGGCLATFDTPLGFRHGPKTIVNQRTLVVVFVSNDPHTRRYDLDLLTELGRERMAGEVLAVTAGDLEAPAGTEVIRVPHLAAAADVDLLLPFVVLAQTLAFHESLRRGLTPDSPNRAGTVNRVVKGVRIHTLE